MVAAAAAEAAVAAVDAAVVAAEPAVIAADAAVVAADAAAEAVEAAEAEAVFDAGLSPTLQAVRARAIRPTINNDFFICFPSKD